MPMKRERIGISEILKAVSLYFSIEIEYLTGPLQIRHIVYTRKIAMYLCREILNYSYFGIGIHFGNRTHSTVIHAVKDVGNRIANDNGNYRNDVVQITNLIYKDESHSLLK